MSDFNLDTVEKDGYKPVSITYREKEDLLGASAYGLMMTPGVIELEDMNGAEIGMELIDKFPELLKLLCPDLAKVMTDPTVSEQILMIRAITEVLNRLGKFRFTDEKE